MVGTTRAGSRTESQRHKSNTVGEVSGDARRHLQGQPGFANPTRTRHRQEADIRTLQELACCGHVMVPPDQWRQRGGK